MKVTFSSALLATSLLSLFSNVFALPSAPLQPRQSGVDDTPHIGIAGPVVARQEIDAIFRGDQQLWTLYINGLYRMMTPASPSSNPNRISYYSLGAIHGSDRVFNGQTWGKANGGGYCMHGSIHFPIWHRPYLGMFEYALYTHCRAWIATLNANDQTTYNRVLSRFRIPYWDWASSNGMYSYMTTPTISIWRNSRDGVGNIQNPLYSYRLRDVSGDRFVPLGGNIRTTETIRSPANSGGQYVSQPAQSQRLLRSSYSNNRNSLNVLFQRITRWNEFASQSVSGSSIESLHGSPHVNVGGYSGEGSITSGHMTIINQAGFDPLFWLHHANVDRQFAIWQVINPNSYTTGQATSYSPFYDYRARVWANDQNSRNVRYYNYTYPDLSQATTPAAMKALMSQKYGSSSPRATVAQATNQLAKRQDGANSTTVAASNDTPTLLNTTVAAPIGNTDLSTPADPAKLAEKGRTNLLNDTTTYNEYQLTVSVPSSAVSGSFKFLVFIGNYPKDKPSEWVTHPNYVGSYESFTLGDKMSQPMDLKGNVLLTQAVLNLINRDGNGLNDLRVRNVRVFLKTNLHFEVASAEDVKIDKSKFKIICETARVKTPKAVDSSQPASSIWSDWRPLFTVQ